MEFSTAALHGRMVMVVSRRDKDSNRYFFVQYHAGIPIFEFNGQLWRRVNPTSYFAKARRGDGLTLKSRAIYDLVLTTPLSLPGVQIRTVHHQQCIPAKCKGADFNASRKVLRNIGKTALE